MKCRAFGSYNFTWWRTEDEGDFSVRKVESNIVGARFFRHQRIVSVALVFSSGDQVIAISNTNRAVKKKF